MFLTVGPNVPLSHAGWVCLMCLRFLLLPTVCIGSTGSGSSVALSCKSFWSVSTYGGDQQAQSYRSGQNLFSFQWVLVLVWQPGESKIQPVGQGQHDKKILHGWFNSVLGLSAERAGQSMVMSDAKCTKQGMWGLCRSSETLGQHLSGKKETGREGRGLK